MKPTAGTPELPANHWWTWANALTLSRLAAAPMCALAIAHGAAGWAALAFAVAVLTDWLDGRVARRLRQASALGGLLDHASDASFVALGLAALAQRGEVPPLLPALVALSFLQYALDSRALAGRSLIASALGRGNGVAYFALLGAAVVRDLLGWGWPGSGLLRGLGWGLVASTLLSMMDRARSFIRRRSGAGGG